MKKNEKATINQSKILIPFLCSIAWHNKQTAIGHSAFHGVNTESSMDLYSYLIFHCSVNFIYIIIKRNIDCNYWNLVYIYENIRNLI